MFDVTDQKSFANVRTWLHEIATHATTDVVKLLVGTKCDLDRQRSVTTTAALEFAKSVGLEYMEASAKTGQGVEEVFQRMVSLILEKKKTGPSATPTYETQRLLASSSVPENEGCAC